MSAEKAVAERNILPCLARNRTLVSHVLNPVDVRKINFTCTRNYRGAANCEIAGTNLVAFVGVKGPADKDEVSLLHTLRQAPSASFKNAHGD